MMHHIQNENNEQRKLKPSRKETVISLHKLNKVNELSFMGTFKLVTIYECLLTGLSLFNSN